MRFSFDIVGVTRSQVNAQQIQLQPIDPTDLTSFSTTALYNLKEVLAAFDPVILGAQPEQTIYVYALEILLNIVNIINLPDISKYRVVALDYANPRDLTPAKPFPSEVVSETLAAIVVRLVEIPVALPDMEILEASNNYSHNGLGMGFKIKVVDPAGEESKPCLPFPVWLPLPFLGKKLEWKLGEVSAGFSDPQASTNVEDITHFMGNKARPDPPVNPTESQLTGQTDTPGGQVRWYDMRPGSLTDLKIFGFGSPVTIDPYPTPPHGQLTLPLPTEAASKLAKLRRAGRWLYNECDVWRDDYVHFTTPRDPGIAVLWRDDLPSRPILCLDLEEYLFNSLTDLAARLWRPVASSGEIAVKIPIPLGQMVHLTVERLEDAINNELVQFIYNKVTNKEGKLTITFGFLTDAYTDNEIPQSSFHEENISLASTVDPAWRQCIGSQVDPNNYRSEFEPGVKGISSSILSFGYLPQIIPDDSTGDPSSAFSVQLQVMIDGRVELLGQNIHFDHKVMPVGPNLVFIPEPVRLPTLAIFFSDSYFQGIPLIMLPGNSGLFKPDIHFDANSPGSLNDIRKTVVDKLVVIYNLIKLAKLGGQNETFDLILNALGVVINSGRLVVDTTGKIENLSDCITEKHWLGDSHFNDAISSVVLIGPPHKWSHTVFKCYQHSLRKPDHGLCLRLKLPDNQFIAAIPSFKRLLEKALINGFMVELPYGDAPNNLPSFGAINFNDVVSAIEIVKE